jgi:predicted transposase
LKGREKVIKLMRLQSSAIRFIYKRLKEGKKDNEIFDPRKILSAFQGRVDKYLDRVRLSQTS